MGVIVAGIVVGAYGFHFFQAGEAVTLEVDQFVVDRLEFGGVILASGFEVGESGFNHFAAGFFFFWIFLIRIGEAEGANERRKRESLQDEGDKNYGEGEEDYEVALRKRRAVAQIFRQRNSGGQGADAAHTGPADNQDRARGRKRRGLVKDAPPDEI